MSITYATDGSPVDTRADPACRLCDGHGIVDAGNNYGAALVPCPACCELRPPGPQEDAARWASVLGVR